jgi:hypothetical protein
MNTLFILLARHDGLPVVPLKTVAADYFNLTVEKLQRKILDGEIRLPIVRMESGSQKAARGVPVADLAAYIDQQVETARKERDQLCR